MIRDFWLGSGPLRVACKWICRVAACTALLGGMSAFLIIRQSLAALAWIPVYYHHAHSRVCIKLAPRRASAFRMTDVYAQQSLMHLHNANGYLAPDQACTCSYGAGLGRGSHTNMHSCMQLDSSAQRDEQDQQDQQESSAVQDVSVATDDYLPPGQFSSSPTERALYPASTMAAVEAKRARFFAQQSGCASRRARSRPTPTGSTSLKRPHKSHPLSSNASCSYRQSFFEQCQRAMETTRSVQRTERVSAFRKGADAFTRDLHSDDMDEDDLPSSSVGATSSPPASSQASSQELREEDDELTRRRIIGEYSRLKRIYELKGHLEIGWIDPDHLDWLESEIQQQQHASQEEHVHDPYLMADDETLEQLWIESQQQSQTPIEQGQQHAIVVDEFEDDASFEHALAMLPV